MLTLVLFAALAGAPEVSCEVPVHGKVQLTLPAGWKLHRCETIGRPAAATMQVRPETGKELKLLVTAAWVDPKKGITEAELKKAAADTLAVVQRDAVETNIPLQTLKGEAVKGFWFQATDRNAARGPDDYPRMAQAVLQSGELKIVVTFLTRSTDDKAMEPAIAALKSLRHVAK